MKNFYIQLTWITVTEPTCGKGEHEVSALLVCGKATGLGIVVSHQLMALAMGHRHPGPRFPGGQSKGLY